MTWIKRSKPVWHKYQHINFSSCNICSSYPWVPFGIFPIHFTYIGLRHTFELMVWGNFSENSLFCESYEEFSSFKKMHLLSLGTIWHPRVFHVDFTDIKSSLKFHCFVSATKNSVAVNPRYLFISLNFPCTIYRHGFKTLFKACSMRQYFWNFHCSVTVAKFSSCYKKL